jgi:hypothetical protein
VPKGYWQSPSAGICRAFDLNPPPGEHSDEVTISTNFKGGRTVTISALVVVPSPISVAPAKIVLEENPITKASRTIIIKAPQNEKIEIARIETPAPEITTQVQPLGEFGVRIIFGNLSQSRDLDSKVIIIHLATGREVEIPLQIKSLP